MIKIIIPVVLIKRSIFIARINDHLFSAIGITGGFTTSICHDTPKNVALCNTSHNKKPLESGFIY